MNMSVSKAYAFALVALFGCVTCGLAHAKGGLPARPTLLEPTWLLNARDTHLWLDAWDYDTFTTDTDGNVTAWADKSGNAHDAAAYPIGDTQVYGTVGVTNGVPAYLMGPIASRIDLAFERCTTIRTVFWVMDIAGKHAYDTDKIAFFLGDSYSFRWDFHGGYNGQIASKDANAAFLNGLFRIDGDGSCSGQLTSAYAPSGTHIYTSVPMDNLAAGHLSRDRNTSTTRVGARALSELVILTRPLATNEIETMETYFRAKWFGAAESVSSEGVAKSAYPSLTVNAGAGLVLGPSAYANAVDVPCIAVFGTLTKGTADKIRIVSGIVNIPRERTILACGAAEGIASLDDFELVGFPQEAQFSWDGTKLRMSCDRPRTFVPAVLQAETSHHASLWLDAADAASFTTNETGGVTAWTDKSGSGHTALAYKIGDEQKYGVRGVTNGCPAFLMGPCGSDIDLRFVPTTSQEDDIVVRAAYWVMDIVQNTPYLSEMGTSGWPTAFFLGAENNWDFHRGQQSPSSSVIADMDNAAVGFRQSDFRIDGVRADPTKTKPALGTHIYSAQMAADCHAGMISQDRALLKRNGGRALSELVLFGFDLTDSEKTQMANYLAVKWSGETVTLAAKTNAVAPISFPNLVLDEGAHFRVCSTAIRTAAAGVSVFGALQKGTAEKVRIAFAGTPVGFGSRTLFECADLFGYEKSDFEVTGLPVGVMPYWEGNALKIDLQPTDVEPTVLKAAGSSAPWIWLDAADDATFTKTAEGGVTAWADKGAFGHDATAYQVGDDQVCGTVGMTNGVPAYLMGAIGSRIDLGFATTKGLRTVFWVMDIAGRGADNNHMAFFLGCVEKDGLKWEESYPFHRGYQGQILSVEAANAVKNGRFSIDGDWSYSGNLTTTYPPTGTHLYSTITTDPVAANQLSRFNKNPTRAGGRALSELVIFERVLSDAEYASVENYLNAKWFGKGVTVSEAVSVTSPVTYPFLTLGEGASFTVSRAALPKGDAAITVYGTFAKSFAGKISIAFADGEKLPGGVRTLLRCADAGGLTLDDFELTGFPEGVEFDWNGQDLTVVNQLGLMIMVK